MSIWFFRQGNAFLPTDDESNKVLNRYSEGECACFKHINIRSVQFHRLYFSLCRTIGQNQDPQRDEHSIDMELRFRAGHKELVGTIGDQELWVPKRIAFDKLTADEWGVLWPNLELAMRETFGIGPEDTGQR